MYIAFDKSENKNVCDEDGKAVLFKTISEGKNYFFDLGYKYNWVLENILFILK